MKPTLSQKRHLLFRYEWKINIFQSYLASFCRFLPLKTTSIPTKKPRCQKILSLSLDFTKVLLREPQEFASGINNTTETVCFVPDMKDCIWWCVQGPSLSLVICRPVMWMFYCGRSRNFSGVKSGFGSSKSEGMKPEQQPVSGCPSLRVIIVCPNHSSRLSLLRFYPLITSVPPGGPSVTHSGRFFFFTAKSHCFPFFTSFLFVFLKCFQF